MKRGGGRSSSQGHRGKRKYFKQVQHLSKFDTSKVMKNSPVQVQISPYPLIHSLNHKAHHRTPSAAGPPCPGTLVTTFPPPTLKPTRTERHTSTSKPDASYTPPTPPIFTPHLLHLPPPTPLRSAFSLRGAGAEAEQGHPQAGEQPRAVAPLGAAEDLRHVRLLDVEGVGASNEEGERDGGCAVGTLGPPRWVNEEERLVWSCLV